MSRAKTAARVVGVGIGLALAVGLGIASSLWVDGVNASWREPRAFEYLLGSEVDEHAHAWLDQVGAEGWEAVTCRRALRGREPVLECIFKRPK